MSWAQLVSMVILATSTIHRYVNDRCAVIGRAPWVAADWAVQRLLVCILPKLEKKRDMAPGRWHSLLVTHESEVW